jgi:hypothetical protein
MAGTSVNNKWSTDFILLKADGTFSLQQRGASLTGTYTPNGAAITFKFSDGDGGSAKLDKDTVDQDGDRWVKKP